MTPAVFKLVTFPSITLLLSLANCCEGILIMKFQLLSSIGFRRSGSTSRCLAAWGGSHYQQQIAPTYHHGWSTQTRLFGTRRGASPNPPLGTIGIYNDQKALPNIDEEALRDTVQKISKILGYETYDVTLLLVDDEEMQETNLESRGVDAPTDILSFPFLEAVEPGLLEEPEFDVPDYYTLGDMMIDVPYVIRRCQEDMEDEDVEESPDSDEEDDRGVSGAMAKVSDPEKRIHMLLVHGMLHLVGHDHEEDDEYEEMVQREEEILKELGILK